MSLYFHLNKFDVIQGDIVNKGQIIGRSGCRGRATGPHLHLSISVQGQFVDPMPMFEKTSDQLIR
ncbi:MAG TPA: hypothetical protein DCR95_10045 [Desulfobacter sp.]|nr:hypothetical protein [Desulfobacter sp.]